jgi:hypothetical protein
VKTRRPGRGDWTLNDTDLKGSIERFVRLVERFGDKICRLVFVSNANFATHDLGIADRNRLRRSPLRVLDAVKNA